MIGITVGSLLVAATTPVAALNNGLASTPQMGWNSWNHFACNISEELIKETADALIETGLAKLGYNYLNLDDCWQAAERDKDGSVQADRTRFPSGLQALGDYIHEKGLKFGIYSSAGFKTCQGLPASLGVEDMDAAKYAEWGVDYLKYDDCYTDHGVPQQRYPAMARALQNSGRDILYSLCEWGRENPATWAPEISNSWRVTLDIRDEWRSIVSRANIDAPLWRYAGPGGWNDPDMLEVGNGGCSFEEYKSHFSLWAMLKAPLIVGNDVRGLSAGDEALQILSNEEIIAINQDSLGRQARRTWSDTLGTREGDHLIASKCNTDPEAYLDSPDDQQWILRDDGRIESKSTGRCLVEETTLSPWNVTDMDLDFSGGQHSVGTVDCSRATVWTTNAGSGGLIKSTDTGRCLEVLGLLYPTIAEGKRVQTGMCRQLHSDEDYVSHRIIDVREHQQWTAPRGTLLNLYQRQCMTIDRDAPPGLRQEVWATPLEDGSLAVMVFNKGLTSQTIEVTWDMIGIHGSKPYHVRDLWAHEDDKLPADRSIFAHVESHGVAVFKLTPV